MYKALLALYILLSYQGTAQIANYVSNGGFEKCEDPNAIFKIAVDWNATNSTKFSGLLFSKVMSPYLVPKSNYGYQWPRHGNNYFGTSIYCSTCTYNTRGYPRNKLKGNLENGKTYCFSLYISLTNASSYAVNSLGVFFGDSSTDTIKECTVPLIYLTPQIQNPTGHFLSDTLNWMLFRGLYTANGSEKYIMIGNFYNDANTDTLLVNSTTLPQKFCNYLFDDISCIDIDLPAFAGNDTSFIPGDSLYLGRQSDVGIDEACMWYKLPVVITPTTPAMDTVAGMWIRPTETSTYVVRQDICGNVKWDTVVVYINPVGLEKLKAIQNELKLFPVPAKDYVELSTGMGEWLQDFTYLAIYNTMGQLIRQEELRYENKRLRIRTEDLEVGMYSLEIRNSSNEKLIKKLIIAR